MKKKLTFVLALLIMSIYCINAATIYVKHDASGGNDGSSWTDAYTLLQSALDASSSGDEIWVARGTYLPTTKVAGTSDRTKAFQMVEGVSIYGGFAGTESAVSARTDFGFGESNETTLSGDFIDDDVITGSGSTLSISGNTENAYHVFHHPTSYALTSSAVLDGFTVRGGYADGSDNPWDDGAGLYNSDGQSPTINNCFFTGNMTKDNGGGLYNVNGSNSIITNSTFSRNMAGYGADGHGGGMANYNSVPQIVNCLFSDNRAYTSTDDLGGGMWNVENSDFTMVNCTFTGNFAKSGGAIYNTSGSDVTMINCIVYGNTIGTGVGSQIRNYTNADLNISYSCYELGGISSSDGGTATLGDGMVTSDPAFADNLDDDHPYALLGTSPCADAGNSSSCSESYDIRGSAYDRKLDKSNGASGTIDIGAYEYNYNLDWSGEPIIFVDDDASGNDDGSNWNDAYVSLQDAITNASSGVQIWIAAGAYYPELEVGGTGDRYKSFQMKNDVEICGGFAMTEQTLAQRTDYGVGGANETILSGDIGIQGDVSDNCYHVFSHSTAESFNSTAVLNGVTLTKGNANGGDWTTAYGGGMLNNRNGITLRYVTFYDNTSGLLGGGAYMNTTSTTIPTISYCTFSNNTSTDVSNGGGGIYHAGNSLVLDNCTISNNTSAKYGGGLYTYASTTLNNCTISNNSAQGGGGAIHRSGTTNYNNCVIKNNDAVSGYGGGIYHINSGIINLTNCLVYENYGSTRAGGLYSNCDGPSSIVNCTFAENLSGSFGGGGLYFNSNVIATVKNTIVYGNTCTNQSKPWNVWAESGITFSYSNIWGCGGSENWAGGLFGNDGGNNIDADPKFVGSTLNPDHPYVIFQYSACADAGDNYAINETYDIRGSGFDRELNKTTGLYKNMQVGGVVDMGAYEYKAFSDPNSIRTLTWDGSAGSDWTDNFNWNLDNIPSYPDSSDNLTIPNVATDPVIAADATANCNDLSVQNGATLTIESNATGTGSLIVDGAVTNSGTITVQRFLADNAWHLVSPSTTGVTANDFYWDDSPICWLASHSESTDLWTYNTELSTAMPVGQGWSVWIDDATKSDITANMTGDIRAEDLSVSLTKNNYGWNLIGNPFTSAIDRDLGSWGSNTTGSVYVWDNDYNSGDYRTWNGSTGDLSEGIIPISQGFFVQASASGSFAIPAAARLHNSTNLYKTGDKNTSPYLKIQLKVGAHGNTAFIGFPENGTSQFDDFGDATKLYSNSDLPQIYLLEDDVRLSTNALEPLTADGKIVPLHLDQAIDGDYTFTFSQLDNLPDLDISIEDPKTGIIQDVKTNPVYAFSALSGDDVDRFLLHFKSTTFGLEEEDVPFGNLISVYSANNRIYILSKDAAANENGFVEIYNLSGQMLFNQPIQSGALVSVFLKSKASYLLVRVIKPSGSIVNKVFKK
jgi:Right handed beta helix region